MHEHYIYSTKLCMKINTHSRQDKKFLLVRKTVFQGTCVSAAEAGRHKERHQLTRFKRQMIEKWPLCINPFTQRTWWFQKHNCFPFINTYREDNKTCFSSFCFNLGGTETSFNVTVHVKLWSYLKHKQKKKTSNWPLPWRAIFISPEYWYLNIK